MNRTLLRLMLTSLLTLTACARQNDTLPKERALKIPELTLNSKIKSNDALEHSKPSWWAYFQDPQLDHLISLALKHNPDLAIARARINEAQGIARIKGAKLLPNVNANSSIQAAHWTENQFYPPPYGGSDTWNNALNLNLSYSLDLWGRYRDVNIAKRDVLAAAEQEHRAAALLLENNILQNYIRYVQTEALIKNNHELKTVEYKLIYIARMRLQHGLDNATSMHQLQQGLQELNDRKRALTGKSKLFKEELAALAGIGTSFHHPLDVHSLPITRQWQPPTFVPASLVGARPDVIARRWQVEAAAANVRVAQTEFYPNINIVAFLGGLAAAGSFLQFLHVSSAQYGVGPSITLPIFEGGRLRGNLREKSAEYNEAVSEYNETLIDAFKQVAQAITQLDSLSARRRTLHRRLADLRLILDISKKRFSAGITNKESVLQKSADILRLKQKKIDLNAAALENLGTLYASLGGAFMHGTLPDQNTPQS